MSQPHDGGQPPNSGGLPPAPPAGYGSMPQAPQEYTGGPLPRPSTVTAAAVLAFVQAGITALTTLLVWIGVANLDGGWMAYRGVLALAQTAGVILLIMGGLRIMNGTSRNLLLAGAAVEIAIALAWLVEFGIADAQGVEMFEETKATGIGAAIILAAVPAISALLALGRPATQFLESRRR